MHNIGRLCKTAGLKCINIYNDLPSKSYSLSNFNLEHSLTFVTASCHNIVIAIQLLSLSVVNGSLFRLRSKLHWPGNSIFRLFREKSALNQLTFGGNNLYQSYCIRWTLKLSYLNYILTCHWWVVEHCPFPFIQQTNQWPDWLSFTSLQEENLRKCL